MNKLVFMVVVTMMGVTTLVAICNAKEVEQQPDEIADTQWVPPWLARLGIKKMPPYRPRIPKYEFKTVTAKKIGRLDCQKDTPPGTECKEYRVYRAGPDACQCKLIKKGYHTNTDNCDRIRDEGKKHFWCAYFDGNCRCQYEKKGIRDPNDLLCPNVNMFLNYFRCKSIDSTNCECVLRIEVNEPQWKKDLRKRRGWA